MTLKNSPDPQDTAWGGQERRCPPDALVACRAEVDERIDSLHTEITIMRGELAEQRIEYREMRADVRDLTAAVSTSNSNLATISLNLEKLADLPETWQKVRGFWAVMRFLRENFLLLAILFGGLSYLVVHALS